MGEIESEIEGELRGGERECNKGERKGRPRPGFGHGLAHARREKESIGERSEIERGCERDRQGMKVV